MVKEAKMGNVLMRMHRCDANDEPSYALFLFAYNSWADQEKLIYAITGVDEENAYGFFEESERIVHGYSWVEDAFIVDDPH